MPQMLILREPRQNDYIYTKLTIEYTFIFILYNNALRGFDELND